MRIEEKIRKSLASNLKFLDSDLELIQEEFHLKAEIGAKGFIDILAKDSYNNFVIIEIKRSESSARQTINELLKYQGLLKQLFRAQESEIKLIVISTLWQELIIPFSEIHNRISITGYEIEINSSSIPISKKVVVPLNLDSLSRKLSPAHSCDLFYDEISRNSFVKTLSERIIENGINDFVIIKLKSSGTNKQIVYPFVSYMAFQRQSKEQYLRIIPDLVEELEDCEFNSQEEEMEFIDSCFLVKLEAHEINDSAEYGNPEKFMNIVNNKDWIIESITKYGAFEKDPRYIDSLIINEFKGYDGDNPIKYLDFADSTQFKKLEKLKTNFRSSLQGNPNWLKSIDSIFDYALNQKKPFRVVVEIFYPSPLLHYIYQYFKTKDKDYLPCYNLYFIFKDSEEFIQFQGHLVWNGKKPSLKKLIKKLSDPEAIISINLGLEEDFILKILNLNFVNQKIVYKNGILDSSQNILIAKGEFTVDIKKHNSVADFFLNNIDTMHTIHNFYDQYYFTVLKTILQIDFEFTF